jgi:hypothetical protein
VLVGGLVGHEDLVSSHSIRVVLIASAYDGVLAPLVFLLVGWALHDPRATSRARGSGWGA